MASLINTSLYSMTLNAVELGQMATKSGVRMSTSTAQETLQTTQVSRGEMSTTNHVIVSNSIYQVWCSIFVLPWGHRRNQFKPGQPYVWFWGAVPTRGIQVCYLRMRCPEVQSMKTICRILQEEAEAEAVLKINTQGCIPRIQTLIENNLYPVVGVAIGVAVSQV